MDFSVVSYLDKVTSLRIRTLQEALSEITGSKSALASWEPHLTLGDGISIDEKDLTTLLDLCARIAKVVQPFQIHLSGFGSVESRLSGVGEVSTKYAIWVNVVPDPGLLSVVNEWSRASSNFRKWYRMPVPYHPHVTLAFRDLDKEGFYGGLRYLQDKKCDLFTDITNFSIVQRLKNTDAEYRRFELGS
ncbi:MAG: 2'-5' RNA ligase family protein [Candidatus Saccharibacteria bacterium]|nr:2'-5' RNA ligase family protein [Candidatus Saccharibacteria bacterium]